MLSAASSALVVAGFLIFNAMSMAITQRRPMISMLRAIGAKQRQIVRDLLVEAGLVGLVGGVLGSALGVLIGRQAIAPCPRRCCRDTSRESNTSCPATRSRSAWPRASS